MKLSKRKVASLAVTENIEMESFSSEEVEEEHSFHQRHLEHQTEPNTASPAKIDAEHHSPGPDFMEEIEIEMKVFPPFRVSERELTEIKSDHPSIMNPTASPNKANRLKWKRLTPQKTGLVVKDVVCLPRGHYLKMDRHIAPRGKEQAALSAIGMTARITVDSGWSASQMESWLVTLFRGRFIKQKGQQFSFTYLQCVSGSRVLFVPDPPAEGWTGEQLLRISGHGALYILSHQDYPQLTLDLDSILRLFRQENTDGDVETRVRVRRRNLLHSALKVVRRPGFCFKTTPVISFRGEKANGHEGPLREFFRLTLLELQQSSVFEGHPGRLFLTYDITALEDGKYYEAGVLIGWSLAQGGPGPRCLHPALYQLMSGHEPSLEDFSWRDIVDAEVQIRLQQLQSCTDVKLLSPSLCDWVSSCGIPQIYSACSDEIPALYIRLVKHYIYHRVVSMISQFTEGMNSCGGLWDMVHSHWEAFMPVMTSAQQQPLTLEEFKQLFTVCYSQLRAAEETTAGHWETVLALVSDGQADFTFQDLLAFITGADHLPPLGFPRLISLHFYSQDAGRSSVRLPHASTCALELFLPRGVTEAADLLLLLSRAVHEAVGFTRFQTEGDGEDSCIEVMTGL